MPFVVKIIERDPQNEARQQRFRKLADIAEEGGFSVNRDFSTAWLAVREKSGSRVIAFYIYPGENRIDVYEKTFLDGAVRLAELYERPGESEFTVQKKYA